MRLAVVVEFSILTRAGDLEMPFLPDHLSFEARRRHFGSAPVERMGSVRSCSRFLSLGSGSRANRPSPARDARPDEGGRPHGYSLPGEPHRHARGCAHGHRHIGRRPPARGLPFRRRRRGELLIVAGIHGGYEWNTVLLADALIANLRDGSVAVPPEVTLYLLRDLNPDGYARSHGDRGPCQRKRRRPQPQLASQLAPGLESRRLLELSTHQRRGSSALRAGDHRAAGLHPRPRFPRAHQLPQRGAGIFPGGQPATDESLRLAEAIAAVTEYSYPPQGNGCEYTGQFADWAAAQGIAAVDVELSTHDSIDLWVNLSVLETFLSFDPQPLP